jgi:hypothetical protein
MVREDLNGDIPTRVCGTHVRFIRSRGLDMVNGDVLENAKLLDSNLWVSTAPTWSLSKQFRATPCCDSAALSCFLVDEAIIAAE